MNFKPAFIAAALALAPALTIASAQPALAATAEELNADAQEALNKLYASDPGASAIGRQAKAILVFPNIVKAGFVFGGGYGEGVMMQGGRVVDYYNSVTGSWGLQAGIQAYGYVVFLITDSAVDYIIKSKGFEVGVGPTVVIVDKGAAANLSSTTLKDDAYAFVFDQRGLMASVSIEGTKITRINR